jgi:hypothetical protein
MSWRPRGCGCRGLVRRSSTNFASQLLILIAWDRFSDLETGDYFVWWYVHEMEADIICLDVWGKLICQVGFGILGFVHIQVTHVSPIDIACVDFE